MDGLNPGGLTQAGATQLQQQFTHKLLSSAIDATIRAGLETAINNGDFDQLLKSGLLSAATDSALAVTHMIIGSMAKEAGLADASLEKVLMHAGAVAAKLNAL